MTEISLKIPPEIKYLSFVEDSIDSFINIVYTNYKVETVTLLKSVMNEAFVNVIKHSSPQKNKIQIRYELNSNLFRASITDYGTGLKIKNKYPPYLKNMINGEFDLISVLDGKVKAKINDPYNCELIFESVDYQLVNKKNIIHKLQDSGRGLSIMIKTMDAVKFQYSDLHQNTLTLYKKL